MKYIYDPYWMDLIDPNIMCGHMIEKGSKIAIIKNKIDPSGIFRIISDGKGNVQSVYKDSIKKIESDKPEYGKIYSLTGGPDKKCIANGNNWKESEVI